MERVTESTGTLEWARTYTELRWPIIPLVGKVPAVRGWRDFRVTAADLEYWFKTRRCNIGLRTGESGYIVVDTDSTDAENWAASHLPETPMRALTGTGSRHRYYRTPKCREIRNKQGWNGIPGLDVRGQGGYIVLPGSIHPLTGKPYEWEAGFSLPQGLPPFSLSLVRDTERVRASVAGILDPDRALARGRAYLAKIEPAVSGQAGHTKTFTTALKLARVVGYDSELLWQLLCEYNARCEPSWSEKELRHKWADALNGHEIANVELGQEAAA
ncbi:MAG: bifunctional DNA primase/polymerase [Gemmataceae bacterium]